MQDTHELEITNPQPFDFETKIAELVDMKINPAYYQLLLANRDNPNMPAAKDLCESKMIRIPFILYKNLSHEDRKKLKSKFENSVRSSIGKSNINNETDAAISPNSDTNVIDHEFEHLDSMPSEIANRLVIEATITYIDNQYYVQGQAYFGNQKLEPKTMISSLIAPKVLSHTDVEIAEKLLLEIDDPEYERDIRQIIKSKQTNSGIAY